MKRSCFALGLAALALMVFSACTASAAEGRKPRKPRVTGLVKATKETKDGKEEITAVTITTRKTDKQEAEEYQVTLDDEGKKLGKELDGKRASVTGTIETKGEGDKKVKTITVESFKEATARKAKEQPK